MDIDLLTLQGHWEEYLRSRPYSSVSVITMHLPPQPFWSGPPVRLKEASNPEESPCFILLRLLRRGALRNMGILSFNIGDNVPPLINPSLLYPLLAALLFDL